MAGAVSTSEPVLGNAETGFVEIDPTGRYGRYSEVVGKGPFKTVYKAFDQLEGMEVAWSHVRLSDVIRDPDDLELLCSKAHLLQTVNHKNIVKLYCYWVDKKLGRINFITEFFTSGNLREYRKKHKRVDLRVLKNWSRQILHGLLYLHSRNPPIIHMGLRCDNIFINGNTGEVKIGDLGLAAVPYHAQPDQTVIGSPEYVAPELYSEDYNELVDIYAFGMCLLELVTFEYPYQECSNATEIFRKILSGIKPDSLSKVKDLEVKRFLEKCICRAPERFPAKELLLDPFLQLNNVNCSTQHCQPSLPNNADSNAHTDQTEGKVDEEELNPDLRGAISSETDGKASCSEADVDPFMTSQGFSLSGERKDANTIFLKLRIFSATGFIHHIDFPFDVEQDTSVSVAIEMVSQLNLTDYEITNIAAMIDREIQSYIPEWIPENVSSDGNGVTSPYNMRSDKNDDLKFLSNSGGFPAQSQSNVFSQSNVSAFTNHASDVYSSLQNEQKASDEIRNDPYMVNLSDSSAVLKMPPDTNSVVRAESADQDADNETPPANSDKIFMQDDHDHVKFMAERLEIFTVEHEKELLESEEKHFEESADILKELPSGFDNSVLPRNMMNFSDNKTEWQIKQCTNQSEESGSGSVPEYSVSNIPRSKDSSGENGTDEKSTVIPTASEFSQT